MHTALACLELVARINGEDIDVRALIREFGFGEEELSIEELIRAAKKTGFRARQKTLKLAALVKKYPLPAILCLHDGKYAILLKAHETEEKALVFFAGKRNPDELSFEQIHELCGGNVLLLNYRLMNSGTLFGFAWFYTEMLKYKPILAEVLLGSFVVQLFGLVTPLFTQVILDKVVVHRVMSTLDVLAVAFLALTGFEFILNLIRNYVFAHTANKIDATLGAKLFRHLFALPLAYFESRKVGNIATRVRELDNIREFITNKSVSLLIDTVFSVVFLLMMFLYSPQLTWVVLGFVTVVALLYLIVTPEFRKRLENKFQMGAQSQSYLVESITGIQTVKSTAIEGSMQKKWEDALAKYLSASFKLSNLGNVASNISNSCQKLMSLAILYMGVKLVIENQLTIGQLIAFQMFAGQFSQPVIRLVNLWNEFQQALLGVDRLSDILKHPVEVQSSTAITLPSLKGAIRFNEVGFKYSPDGQEVLKNVSFSIAAGTSIGIVGKTGSGKSTIARLVQRLYIPNSGEIAVDGLDIRHLNPVWLRQNIGVVPQDTFLFSGTIKENICISKPNAPIEVIIKAAQDAGAHEFISQLPEGYDTIVGERGSTLSGGQKQRIAIARALITNPRILIFDEATSALDYESERVIQANLDKITAGRTFIVIAHRLSTVQKCDKIIVMDKGTIRESGQHNQLLTQNGPYARLFNQQVHTNAASVT